MFSFPAWYSNSLDFSSGFALAFVAGRNTSDGPQEMSSALW